MTSEVNAVAKQWGYLTELVRGGATMQPSPSLQASNPLSPILLTIPIVLHSPLTSQPSQIAGKGEELRIKKTQTLTSVRLLQLIFLYILTPFNYNGKCLF